jgi:hypothetical protein
VTGPRYLIASEVIAGSVQSCHSNTLTGAQWVRSSSRHCKPIGPKGGITRAIVSSGRIYCLSAKSPARGESGSAEPAGRLPEGRLGGFVLPTATRAQAVNPSERGRPRPRVPGPCHRQSVSATTVTQQPTPLLDKQFPAQRCANQF